jgi:acyl-CoA thioester hydrolase
MTTLEAGPTVVASRRILMTYADTDAAGILYYATWFPWMERICVEWLDDNGLRYSTMLAEHGASAVTRATTCDYLSQVVLMDRITVDMFVDHIGARSYRFGFLMTNEANATVVARSTMSLVTLDADGRATPIPAALRALLEGKTQSPTAEES